VLDQRRPALPGELAILLQRDGRRGEQRDQRGLITDPGADDERVVGARRPPLPAGSRAATIGAIT